jgi:acyl carrier protein
MRVAGEVSSSLTHELIELLAEILECDETTLSGDTCFREHKSWDSLAHLSTVVTIDEHYDVVVSQDRLHQLRTISEYIEGRQKK